MSKHLFSQNKPPVLFSPISMKVDFHIFNVKAKGKLVTSQERTVTFFSLSIFPSLKTALEHVNRQSQANWIHRDTPCNVNSIACLRTVGLWRPSINILGVPKTFWLVASNTNDTVFGFRTREDARLFAEAYKCSAPVHVVTCRFDPY